MQFNFFHWLRDGVRQSILLGVSDAVEQLGTPDVNDEISPRLMEFMRDDPAQAKARMTGTSTGTGGSGGGSRKRLGRSLKELETAVPAT